MKNLISSGRVLIGILLLNAAPLMAVDLGSPFGLGPVAQDEIVSLRIEYEATEFVQGAEVIGSIVATIQDNWHINSVSPIDDFTIATELEISGDALAEVSFEFPPHKEVEFSFAGGSALAVYDGAVRIPFRGVSTGVEPAEMTVRLYYQACDDQICLPPRDVVVVSVLGESGVGTAVASDELPTASTGEFTSLADAPKGLAPSLFSGDVAGTFESRGLLLTLVAVFVLGLALNLTPCVYPLIPITVGFFSSQKQGSRMGQVVLSASYVMGIAVTYSALGVFSALSGQLFGAWLQSSAVLIFFAMVMVILSASMFGLYDIQPPQFIMQRAGARGGYFGALIMGLLAGVVAAPCVGPFVISLIALVAQLQSVLLGFLLFFVLALGLGFPFLILGIFSTAANSIPRSGLWMVQVKKAFGFILIALAFYFLRPVIGDDFYRWGIAAVLLSGAGFLVFGKSTGSAGKTIRFVAAAAFLVIGIVFAIPPKVGDAVVWEKYDSRTLEEARVAGEPVMIDFYADWCLPCKELDSLTFTDGRVIEESTRFVRLKADLTRPSDPKTRGLTRNYSILGVPTIVFLDSTGNEVASARLVGFEKKEPFLDRMKSVR